jgi:hypothetical protein
MKILQEESNKILKSMESVIFNDLKKIKIERHINNLNSFLSTIEHETYKKHKHEIGSTIIDLLDSDIEIRIAVIKFFKLIRMDLKNKIMKNKGE